MKSFDAKRNNGQHINTFMYTYTHHMMHGVSSKFSVSIFSYYSLTLHM